MAKEKKKYEYTQISVPKHIKDEAELVMPTIGCQSMTTFVSMAIKSYIAEINKQDRNSKIN